MSRRSALAAAIFALLMPLMACPGTYAAESVAPAGAHARPAAPHAHPATHVRKKHGHHVKRAQRHKSPHAKKGLKHRRRVHKRIAPPLN